MPCSLVSILLLGLALSLARLSAQTYEFSTVPLEGENIRVAGMTVDLAGNLYFADKNSSVRRLSAEGVISTLAGEPNIGGSNDGVGGFARFSGPQGIAVDMANNIYIADRGNHTVRKITPARVVTTLAGKAGEAGFTDGVGSAARFSAPTALAIDAAGNLYVGQSKGLRKVTPAGVVTTLVDAVSLPQVGTPAFEMLQAVSHVAVDAAGNVYFTEPELCSIRKISPNGIISTLAGLDNQNGHADGAGSIARFGKSIGFAVEPDGSLLVTEAHGGTLRRVTAAGVVSTLAGQVYMPGAADGLGGQARFTLPSHPTRASSGTLYVADGTNASLIRKGIPSSAPAAPIIHTLIGEGLSTLNVGVRATLTLSVGANGTSPLAYQWSKNDVPIAGATLSALTLLSMSAADSGSYSVRVTNQAGSISSHPLILSVFTPQLGALASRHVSVGGSFLWGIASGGGRLVAVGTNGTILTSVDGSSWSRRDSGTSDWLVGIAYGAGKFVAVGDRGRVLLSTDGTNWVRAAETNTTQRLNNVVYARNLFVAVGEGGTILTSPDGQIWTPRASGVTTWLRGLAYNPKALNSGLFTAIGEQGVLLTSGDGTVWSKPSAPSPRGDVEALVPFTSGSSLFAGVGQGGGLLDVFANYSLSFTYQFIPHLSVKLSQTGLPGRLRGLAVGANALFATGENGLVLGAPSVKGPWAEIPSGTNANLVGGTFHGNSLFIVGENETILQSEPLYQSRLINISTRASVGMDANAMFSGFVVDGTSPKRVLIRAAGPALATFRLTGLLARPTLTLFDDARRPIATNTGWSTGDDPGAIVSATARVGAFPFMAGSTDSALLVNLLPGSYTAQVSGADSATGLSLIEAYDAEPLANEGSRTINISTRGIAGSRVNRLIAGFAIDGAASRRVLIRAVGPSLAAFGLSGVLAAPQIELFDSRGLRLRNVGAWSTQPDVDELRGAALLAGAFALQEDSKDAALIDTLTPGSYTVQVSGLNDTTGLSLVEVYDLP